MTHERPLEILLVEDNAADARLTMEAFKCSHAGHSFRHVQDGVEALEILRGEGRYTSPTKPDLILMDLNMPRKDGRQLLSEIKADDELRRIPVVVLTTSQAQEDVQRAYSLYANCYICKPIELDDFIRVVKSIEDFWLGTVRLPPI